MFEKPPRYRSYLFTMWEERGTNESSPAMWRFGLEDARTGQRRGFARLDALVAALQQEMAGDPVEERGPTARPADLASHLAGHSRGERSSRRTVERR